MRVAIMLPLVFVILLGAPACDRGLESPAREEEESVVDLSEPISDGQNFDEQNFDEQSDPPARALGLAAILPSTFDGIDPSLLRWDNPAEKKLDESAPLVAIESRILKVEPGCFKRLPGGAGGPVRRVTRDAMDSFLEKVREAGEIIHRSSLRLSAYSGQLSHTVVIEQSAYIQDFTVGPKADGTEGVELKPKIGVLSTGCVLLARPVVVDGEIEIRDLGLNVVEQLGKRECKAVVEHEGESLDVIWEEPVLLVAKPDASLPKTLRLGEDETLLIPLRYEVKQACANVRALVAIDSLEEMLLKTAGPVEHECVVLLNVRRVARED